MRATLRRSPLAPTTVNTLKTWFEANRAALAEAIGAATLLASISAVILQYNRSSTITALSDATVMPLVIEKCVGGSTFEAILGLLREHDIRIGGNNRYPTVKDAVPICESGLGYEGAMILASIAGLAETDEGELPGALALLQCQMKCGLTPVAALGFFEAGLADRSRRPWRRHPEHCRPALCSPCCAKRSRTGPATDIDIQRTSLPFCRS